ncbi:DUF6527 family protein [Kribbella speibonae]|uniref:Uncharacterized protein n=1 Tax=Kribbella speibonae TaxID=1572660 RepID=A0A4R0J0P0_9ACTN|nr:DUF6527 family protein [Kribbella speibonae]TCC38890.1 hypothetical protein E0H92_21220 [Kribbella speibonae]
MNRLLDRTRSRVTRAYRRTRRHGRSRITRAIHVPSRADLPETLNPHRIYLLGGVAPKWALLDCPCGRGHTIELNLANPARTRWEVTTNQVAEPSVHPSIDYQGEPRCHYWLRNGRVYWVPEPPSR